MSGEQRHAPAGQDDDKEAEPNDHVEGGTFAWGRHPTGWAIWFRDHPEVVLERFAPEDRLQSFQRFAALDYRYETRTRRILRAARERALVLGAVAGAMVLIIVGVTVLVSMPPSEERLARGAPRISSEPRREESTRSASPSLQPIRDVGGQAQPLPGLSVYANQSGGYLFSYPDAWVLKEAGVNAELVSPDGRVVMEFGAAPDGPLGRVSEALVSELATPYRHVQLLTPERDRTVQGLHTRVVGGTAIDPRAEGARFLAIAIDGFADNYAILVRFSNGPVVLEALPTIRSIVSSYRVSKTV